MGFKFNPFTGNFDLVNPASPPDTVVSPGGASTDNAIVRFDGTSGTVIQNSNAILDDTGNLVLQGEITATVINGDGSGITNIDATAIADGSVDNTEFQALDGVTFNIQSQIDDILSGANPIALTNGHIFVGGMGNTATDVAVIGDVTIDNGGNVQIVAGAITDGDINAAAAIDATKIADGSVDNTEFQYLDGVTSSIQTQLNSKLNSAVADEVAQDAVGSILTDTSTIDFTYNDSAPSITADIVAGSITNTHINASAAISASKIADGSVNNTEFQYLDGVTSAIQTQLNATEKTANKGIAGGYASLDGGGKVPIAQLPNSIVEFQGNWNASTNTPTLADGVGNIGDVYRVNVAGTQNLGSGSQTFVVGDWVMLDASLIWQKAHAGADVVLSVNGQAGVVVLNTDNIAEGSNLYFTDERAQDAVGGILTNSSKVSLTYSDGTPSITADIVAGSLVNADVNASAAIDASKIANGTVSNTEFQFINSVTSNVQTQIDNITAGTTPLTLTNAHIFVGNGSNQAVDVAVSGDVTITNTGNVQIASGVIVDADVNAAAAIARTKLASGTANHVIINDGSGVLSSEAQLAVTRGGTGAATLTNHGVLLGQGTSAIVATSVGATGTVLKGNTGADPSFGAVVLITDVSGVLPIANGGTNSSTALNNNRVMKSSGSAIVEAAAITANRALISDANGIPTHSTVTSTELANLSGVTGTTGTGNLVLSSAPTLSNPVVGTQSQGDNSTKAASTSYVDLAISNAISGINPAEEVEAATTAASDTSGFTYNNGISGIGATFTGSINTAVTIDGFTFTTLGQRLLVKNDTQSPSGAFNGVYYVTQVQTALLAPILTRALDYNTPSNINSTGAIPVINGTTNADSSWILTSRISTVGTDPLNYRIFTSRVSVGDIGETSFTAADNQAAAANVTGFAFANGTVRSMESVVSIVRNNTYAQYQMNAIQKAASWELSQSRVGDDTGLVFTITTAGQIQYTSTSTGFTSAVKFRAITTSI